MVEGTSREGPWIPRLAEDQCIGCAICVDVCPNAVVAMSRDELRPRWLVDRCHGCAECARQCPTGAILGGAPGSAPTRAA